MSLYDYRASLDLASKDYSFLTLLMALVRKADSINLAKLEAMFPDETSELRKRYNAPGGVLNGEK